VRQIDSRDKEVKKIIELALEEDTAGGDLTSRILIPPEQKSRATIIAKEAGVLAGIDIASRVFAKVEPALNIEIFVNDGVRVEPGEVAAAINGSTIAILRAERTALNFLSRLSGIATETDRYVSGIKDTNAVITDTRKTTPGLRALEKYAVRTGGGKNHRFNLADGILIKDNHIAAAQKDGLSLKDIIATAKRSAPAGMDIEIEVNTFADAAAAAVAGADIVMLDNMSLHEMKQTVEKLKGRVRLEASGGINMENVRGVALTGVDYISIGAITHSARSLDFSLEFEL